MNIPTKRHVTFNWILPAYIAAAFFTFAWAYVDRETDRLKYCAANQIADCAEGFEVLPAFGSAVLWPSYWMIQAIKYVKR